MTGRPPVRDPGELLGAGAIGDAVDRLAAAIEPRRTIAGWATVELDRAEVEVVAALDRRHGRGRSPVVEAAPDDVILGARCRVIQDAGDLDVVLLEPSTEGRIAAALVRHGEGTVVRYLVTDAGAPERARKAGFAISAPAPGPLGAQRLVLGGPRDGPFLVLAGLS